MRNIDTKCLNYKRRISSRIFETADVRFYSSTAEVILSVFNRCHLRFSKKTAFGFQYFRRSFGGICIFVIIIRSAAVIR